MPDIATDATQAQYDAAYLAAQPPAVKTLMGLPGGSPRIAAAQTLVAEGYLVDTTIMVWAWSAYYTMKSRLAYGYTWVPSAGMPPIQEAPGDDQPGVPPYDAAVMPKGGLLVTLDIDLLTPALFPAPKTT